MGSLASVMRTSIHITYYIQIRSSLSMKARRQELAEIDGGGQFYEICRNPCILCTASMRGKDLDKYRGWGGRRKKSMLVGSATCQATSVLQSRHGKKSIPPGKGVTAIIAQHGTEVQVRVVERVIGLARQVRRFDPKTTASITLSNFKLFVLGCS